MSSKKAQDLSTEAEGKVKTEMSSEKAQDLGAEAEGKEKAKEPGKKVGSHSAKKAEEFEDDKDASDDSDDDEELLKLRLIALKSIGYKSQIKTEIENRPKAKIEAHAKVEDESKEPRKVRYDCDQRITEAPQMEGFMKHIGPVHGKCKSACNQCGKKPLTNNKLKSRVESVHEDYELDCDYCLTEAPQKVNFKKHTDLVHEEVKSACNQRGKTESSNSEHKAHMRSIQFPGQIQEDTRILQSWDPGVLLSIPRSCSQLQEAAANSKRLLSTPRSCSQLQEAAVNSKKLLTWNPGILPLPVPSRKAATKVRPSCRRFRVQTAATDLILLISNPGKPKFVTENKGFVVKLTESEIEKYKKRLEAGSYMELLPPQKFEHRFTVRVYSYVLKFVVNVKIKANERSVEEGLKPREPLLIQKDRKIKYRIFQCQSDGSMVEEQHSKSLTDLYGITCVAIGIKRNYASSGNKKRFPNSPEKWVPVGQWRFFPHEVKQREHLLSENDLSLALAFIFTECTNEVLKFNEEGWWKLWQEFYVEEIFERQKWFYEEEEIIVGDLVMFKRESSEFKSHYTLGKVDELGLSHDGRVRNVWIRYKNKNETNPRRVERDIKTIYKVLSIKDTSLHDSLEQAWRIVQKVKFGESVEANDGQPKLTQETPATAPEEETTATVPEEETTAPKEETRPVVPEKKTSPPAATQKSRKKRRTEVEKLMDWSVKLAMMRRSCNAEDFYGLAANERNTVQDEWTKDYFDNDDAKLIGLKNIEIESIFC